MFQFNYLIPNRDVLIHITPSFFFFFWHLALLRYYLNFLPFWCFDVGFGVVNIWKWLWRSKKLENTKIYKWWNGWLLYGFWLSTSIRYIFGRLLICSPGVDRTLLLCQFLFHFSVPDFSSYIYMVFGPNLCSFRV